MDNKVYDVIKELFGITGTKGFSDEEIEQVRSLHGEIPYALELYYREVGRDELVNHTQNCLVVPWKYSWPKSESHLIFYTENQCVCFWGISLDDLGMEDPPVYVTFDRKDRGIWEPESGSLSDFLITMAHIHAAFALPFSIEDIYMISEEEAHIVRRNFREKCKPLMRWYKGGEESGTEVYGNHPCDSIVLMRDADYDLFYASGKEANFKEMNAILSSLGQEY